MSSSDTVFDLLIVGSGPSGLACAIEAQKAGMSAVILEQGSLVDYLRRFPTNVIWFSTPELLEVGGLPFPLTTVRPSRADTLAYYQRVAQHFALDIRTFDAVEGIVREGETFRVTTARGRAYAARNVVVATGYFDTPNRLGITGENLPHVMHHYDEPFRYFGCDIAVVGGRNSAVEAALDLYRHGARVTLIHRGEKLSDGVKYWILPDFENRVKAGQIRTLYRTSVTSIGAGDISVMAPDGPQVVRAGFVFILIGFHPDVEHLRRFGVEIIPETLAPAHNPETLETNVPGLYVAGSVVAGKFNNKIFVENGRLHGGVIVRAIQKKPH